MFTNKSLTIVLPVHNAESRLRTNVRELLELASELTAKFGVLIIDDGSTDSTYEVAAELASHFPQVSVRRHRQCRGLGASLEYVERRVRSDAVIVHDGVTPINSNQVRDLWSQWLHEPASRHIAPADSSNRSCDSLDMDALRSIHGCIESAHRQVIGFHMLTARPSEADVSAGLETTRETTRSDASHAARRSGVGRIPSLPRPRFFAAVAQFAMGE